MSPRHLAIEEADGDAYEVVIQAPRGRVFEAIADRLAGEPGITEGTGFGSPRGYGSTAISLP